MKSGVDQSFIRANQIRRGLRKVKVLKLDEMMSKGAELETNISADRAAVPGIQLFIKKIIVRLVGNIFGSEPD